MQRLGVRLIEQRNPDDAIVLGDAMQAAGIDGLITGRSRPVLFRTVTSVYDETFTRITSRDEQQMIMRARTRRPGFVVPAYEAIYNVAGFAAAPNDERWNAIWTMWVTPPRSTYRALVERRVGRAEPQILPRTIRFGEIRWTDRFLPFHLTDNIALAYRLYLNRVPPRRKKPIDAYLFDVERRDEDNPHTREYHFGGRDRPKATITLHSDGMGDATEADFNAWYRYVNEHIDERTGLDVTVEQARFGDGGRDVRPHSEHFDVLNDALSALWEEFCVGDNES